MTLDTANLPAGAPPRPDASWPPGRRAAFAYFVLAAPALAIVLDTALAMTRGWRDNSRLDRAGLAVMALWLLVVTTAWAIPAGRRLLTARAAQLTALVISVCGMWLVAELALGRLVAALEEPFHLRRPGLTFEYHVQPGVMRDVAPESHVTINAWGMRGADPPPRTGAHRIVCLGGSSTACTYLDDAKAWPQMLEVDLNEASEAAATPGRFWVGNAGLPSLRSDEHRQFVEQSPVLGQIDCLVVQCGINDFMSCLRGPQAAPPLWTHSRVWHLARLALHGVVDPDAVVEDAAGTSYLRRRAARQVAEVDEALPNLEPCLRHFADNVAAIIEACRRQHVRVVFTTQPVLWRADLDDDNQALLWFGELADGRFMSVGQLRAGMDRYNDVLRATCREHDVEVIDLDDLNGDPAVFYDDCHFTETGARRLARQLADWFVAHPADEKGPSAP